MNHSIRSLGLPDLEGYNGDDKTEIKILNFEVLCEDDIYRKVYGLEIGYIFITFSYINIIIEQ